MDGSTHDRPDLNHSDRLPGARPRARGRGRRGAGCSLMAARGVAVAVPLGWGPQRAESRLPHRTGCISALSHNKKGAGARSLSFEGPPVPDRTGRHADKFLPWLIVCGGAEFKNQRPGVGKNLCEATVKPPAVVSGFSAITRLVARMAVCARVRETVASATPLGLIAPPRPSWCGGGALQARSALTHE